MCRRSRRKAANRSSIDGSFLPYAAVRACWIAAIRFTPEQELALRSKRFQVRGVRKIGCGPLASEVMMRFAGNFNPEWGYLAPAPSFIRTVRIAVVAAAVGATAAAAVVFSLVDRPVAEESVAARTLARPTDSAAARTASQAVQLQVPARAALAQVQAKPDAVAPSPSVMLSPANAAAIGPAAGEPGARSTIQRPAGIAALAEAPAATDAGPPQAVEPTSAAPSLQKKRAKRHHSAPRREEVSGDVKGPLALLRSFSARAPAGASWPYE